MRIVCHKWPGRGVYLPEPGIRLRLRLRASHTRSRGGSQMNYVTGTFKRIQGIFRDRRLSLLGLVTILAIFWACYPQMDGSYSSAQQLGSGQWMIEFRAGEEKVQVTMCYDRKEESGWHSSTNGFSIDPAKFTGLSREQVMSSGSHVQFQLPREAGTFNFEGWFKEGNGSGHFTFTPNSGFAAELNRQGFGSPTDEQLLSLAMNDRPRVTSGQRSISSSKWGTTACD